MAPAPRPKPTTTRHAPPKPAVTPLTLDQLVERVLGGQVEDSGRRSVGAGREGGLGSMIRRVLPKKKPVADAADVRALAHAQTCPGPARSAWGLAPTEDVRRLMGLPSASGWVPSLSLAPVFAAVNPRATLCALRGARDEQAEGLRTAAGCWAQADHMRAVGLRAWVLQDLVRTFPGEQEQLLAVSEVTPQSLHRVLEQVPQKILAARKTSARVFEGPLARRVDAALSLLASPTIRGAVPEAPALRPRAVRLAKVSTELAAVAGRIEILHRRRERLQTLTRLGARIGGRPEMSRLLRWEEERLRGAISELDERAGTLTYPEAGAAMSTPEPADAVPVATGDPVIDGLYALDTRRIDEMNRERDPLETGLIDRLQDLNLRVLTDLASLTERVERGLKLQRVGQPRQRSAA